MDKLKDEISKLIDSASGPQWLSNEIVADKIIALITQKDAVAEVPCNNGVIKPCPCCDSRAIFIEKSPPTETTGYYIECHNCGMRTAAWGNPDKARGYWNKRAL
jgi:hypothetical protein